MRFRDWFRGLAVVAGATVLASCQAGRPAAAPGAAPAGEAARALPTTRPAEDVRPAAGRPAAMLRGPLADLPGKPGAHIEKIKALGANQWLVLDSPAADAKWGRACGRSWGGRAFAYAADLGGAFFAGQGQHGFVKPDGHYMDDLWFYDANGNRWICLYPGADTKTLKLHLDEHGFEVDEQGVARPVAFLGHSYGKLTYNTDLRKLMFLQNSDAFAWPGKLPQRWEWLDQNDPSVKKRYYGGVGPVINLLKHPWFWDVATSKFERKFVEGPGGPPGSAENGLLQYIPSMHKAFFAMRKQVWFYDPAINTWAGPQGQGGQDEGFENGCYDPKRGRVYVAHSKYFAYYDLKAQTWTQVHAVGQPENFASSNEVCLTYDLANDILLYHSRTPVHGTLAAYDPKADKWLTPPASFPTKEQIGPYLSHMLLNSFYDPDLNVHFYYLAGDSSSGGARMLAYRYK